MLILAGLALAALAPAGAAAQIDRIDPTLDGEVPAEAAESDAPAETRPVAVQPTPPAPDPYDQRLAALARRFEEGVDAWRRGEYELARGRWLEVLDDLGPAGANLRGRERVFDRHALLHNLGNAAFRLERPLEAVGWYLAALRWAPRDGATRANLELARREAELDAAPAEDVVGSLGSTLELITPFEARWLALLALGPLLVALLGEAVRGGRAWLLAVVLAVFVAALGALPLAWHLGQEDADPVLIVGSGSVPLRAEPLTARPAIGAVEPGERAERIDALPDWIRIERADGTRGWLSRAAVFPLVR